MKTLPLPLLCFFSLILLSFACSDGSIYVEKREEVTTTPEPPPTPEPPEEPYGSFEEVPVPPYREPQPLNPFSDVDCDGIPDGEEMHRTFPNGKKTNPLLRDSDGDGIWDGVELGRSSSPDPFCLLYFPSHLLSDTHRTLTDPTREDTDCDGIADGDEDINKNGSMEADETHPNNPDSDDDGLWDGVELGIRHGIRLHNRLHERHPDPLCSGVTRYASLCSQPSLTHPLNPDSDGDGIADGAEDNNKNGCFEPELGETNPLDPADPADLETLHACRSDNLRPLHMERHFEAQIAMALPDGFADNAFPLRRTLSDSTTYGLFGFNPAHNVAFIAWKHAAWHNIGHVLSMDALRNLASAHADALGATVTPSEFNSWDAGAFQPNALHLSFSVSGVENRSPEARIREMAARLLGEAHQDEVWPALQSKAGPVQHVRAQYVLRPNGEVVVVLAAALDNDALAGSPGFLALADVAGGAALARYFDRTLVHCERSIALRKPVDILFVVDDSNSMDTSQTRLSAAATGMAKALNNSTLDWRAALVSSSYHTLGEKNTRIVRGFTSEPQQLQAWLTTNSTCKAGLCSGNWSQPQPVCGGNTSLHGHNGGCWIGISGNGYEGTLGAARLALMDMGAPNADARIRLRDEANIVVVLLSDAEDQTSGLFTAHGKQSAWEDIQHFIDFFQGKDTRVPDGANSVVVPAIRPGKTIQVNAIYCPAGKTCGDDPVPTSADGMTRMQRVVQATGGVASSILADKAIASSMADIVDRAIGDGGMKTLKPLIGASLRVAIQHPLNADNCDVTNVPRSRQHGFDYDGRSNSVSLFGDCRPDAKQDSRLALSYRAWEGADESRLPCQNNLHFEFSETDYCQGRLTCELTTETCICPDNCGGCPQGTLCNSQTCSCEPPLS